MSAFVDACVYPYGSSVSNFALSHSDLNIDVEVDDPAEFLTKLLEVLRHDKTGVNSMWILDVSSRTWVATENESFRIHRRIVADGFTVWSVDFRILQPALSHHTLLST